MYDIEYDITNDDAYKIYDPIRNNRISCSDQSVANPTDCILAFPFANDNVYDNHFRDVNLSDLFVTSTALLYGNTFVHTPFERNYIDATSGFRLNSVYSSEISDNIMLSTSEFASNTINTSSVSSCGLSGSISY